MCILLFDITGGDNDSEIHTISPAHRIGERTDFSAYPDSCAGQHIMLRSGSDSGG